MPKSNISGISHKIRACRICLDSEYEDEFMIEENNEWGKMFSYCFGVSLTNKDVPRILCGTCADIVKNFAEFKELCLNSDKLWKSETVSTVKCSTENLVFENELEDTENTTFDDNSTSFNEQESIDVTDSEIKDTYIDDSDNSEEILNAEVLDTKVIDQLENELENAESNSNRIENNKIKTTKEKTIFTCNMCKKQYGKVKWYNKHLRSCKTEKRRGTSSNQDLISDSGNSNVNIETSKQSEDNMESASHFCGLCIFSSINIKDLNKHLDDHWSNNDLECKMCEYVGDDLAAICSHRYTHLANNVKKSCICHICGVKKLSSLALQFHYRAVHLGKIGGHCFICNKDYLKLYTWKKHLKRIHGTMRFICDFCGKGYTYKDLLIEHIAGHYDSNKHMCDVCGKRYIQARYLKIHMKTVHLTSRPIKCTHCNRMFKSEFNYNVHQNRLKSAKPHKCKECYKQFSTLKILQIHMISHSDEKPFDCEICGNSYKYEAHLKMHVRNHTGHLPHKCEICKQSFLTSFKLRQHSSVHTGIRAHKCLYCERTFHSKKRVAEHCASRHKTVMKGK